MAPPEQPFPISELEQRIHTHTVNLKEKSRKLGPNFSLKDCELFELVQYSCTTFAQQQENNLKNSGQARVECFPFVRLFRRCGQGDNTFHVETTAWEGQHAWPRESKSQPQKNEDQTVDHSNAFANYDGFYWSRNDHSRVS